MEIGKNYTFYSNAEQKHFAGELIGSDGSDCYCFRLLDNKLRFGTPHDEINEFNNSHNFMEYVAEAFQNKFERNVSVTHNDYEFKVAIPNSHERILDDVEELMNDILEDWWSKLWCELNHNFIQVRMSEVIITFRIHDVHEAEMRFNDSREE